jgi:galactokinase
MITIKNILHSYKEAYPASPVPIIVRSPGRVNIIGEHTDYNGGFVLPAAIDKAAYVAIAPRPDNEVHLFARDLGERFSTTLNELKPIGDHAWPNYMLGPLAQLAHKGLVLQGFNALLTSEVPIGAGLSSSAAIECATMFALDHLFQLEFDRIAMARMAQKAEHDYAGVLCGIMDQFASLMGLKDHVIKLDCRSLDYQYIPFKLDGVKIVLLNTNVKHALASSEYNERRKECNQAVKWINEHIPGVESLRDVTETMLDKYVNPKDEGIDRRARFVVQEIQRLSEACIDLQNGDLRSLGKKMFATHDGLSKMYNVSCRELDWLVDFVKNDEVVIGARMMGGGFGGCTINLVREDAIGDLLARIQPAYEKQIGLPLSHYISSIEDGTGLVPMREYSHV